MLERIITNLKATKYDPNKDYIFTENYIYTYENLLKHIDENKEWKLKLNKGEIKKEDYWKWLESIGAGEYI
jgi:hypothetical protein